MSGTCQGTINIIIPPPPSGCSGVTGDVNGDEIIDSIDATFLRQAVAGTRVLTECQLRRADINRDGFVDGIDSIFLTQYVATGTCGGNCLQNIGQPINPNAILPILK